MSYYVQSESASKITSTMTIFHIPECSRFILILLIEENYRKVYRDYKAISLGQLYVGITYRPIDRGTESYYVKITGLYYYARAWDYATL